MNNFQKILTNINVRSLLRQIENHPELWNIDNSWTVDKPRDVAIYNEDNIVLRFNKSPTWNRPAFSILSEALPIILDLMKAIPGEHLGKAIITRMTPGQIIKEHIDYMPFINPQVPEMGRYPVYWQRYQIPLSVEPGVWFHCGGERLYMEPGNAYLFNNQLIHSVFNDSPEDRISMLVDIRPFSMC